MSHRPSQGRTRRSSRSKNEAVLQPLQPVEEKEEKEEEDVLAELFSILSQGSSHWFSINGDTSCKISLCRLLGFFSPMDYYAFLVLKGLAAYEFNSKKRKMEIAIKINKREHYLRDKRYGLAFPQNAEVTQTKMDMENYLCGKKQQDDK